MTREQEDMMVETCVICEKEREDGIHLYTAFICTDCERTMIETDTNDPAYHEYILKLKKVMVPEIYS